jgi:2-polyprenyl-3-methyl-5-hydroxy-6-metoxy-1,4-benzoquinol methylase
MSLPPCPVCGRAEREPVFRQRLLGRHDVGYHLCGGCGLLQTDTPHWLDEAYSQAIADTDTGLLQRNLEHARLLNGLLQVAFKADGRFVDVAGGWGVLVRLLRDLGFDAYRSDKYCANLFAQGHESYEGLAAEVLFAFEVLEHVSDPVAFVQAEFERYSCRSLVFSTLTFSGTAPAPGWWYYSLESGQHVSFYQARTLEQVAARLGCEYTRIHDGLHLFMAEPLAPALRRALRSRRLRRWFEAWYWAHRRRPALTGADHEAARQRQQAGVSAAR